MRIALYATVPDAFVKLNHLIMLAVAMLLFYYALRLLDLAFRFLILKV